VAPAGRYRVCQAVLVSLLQLLVEKGALTKSDVRLILTDARNSLSPEASSASIGRAMEIIEKDILPKFPAKSG
jgi:hypothetical protein